MPDATVAERVVDDYLSYLIGDQTDPPDLSGLTAQDRRDIELRLAIVDSLWSGATAPALADDPVAAMLGLVPDPQTMLDPTRLRSSRIQKNITASVLAQRLTSRGWAVTTADLVSWERAGHPAASPALLSAIGQELGVPMSQFTRHAAMINQDPVIEAVKRSERFRALATRFATKLRMPFETAASALGSTMLATARRGAPLTEDQWFEALDRLVGTDDREEEPDE